MNCFQKDILVYPSGKLVFNGKEYKCSLGRGGVKKEKVEGDGATPVGCFAIQKIFYREDKLGKLKLAFNTQEIKKNDAWCDDVNDKRYNTHITLAEGEESDERLWREDDLYDVVVVLGYNDNPPVPGKGSAIFMHIAREGYTPTAGCIALSKEDILEILQNTTKETRLCVIG